MTSPKTNKQIMRGEKIFLRNPTRRDLSEFISLNRASSHLFRGLASPPTEAEAFGQFLHRCRRTDSACFFICRIGDGAIVGFIGLTQIFRGGFRSAYLGYHIGAQYARLGFMTEALQLVLRFAFRELSLHRIEANIQPTNVPSLALVKRAGFLREGFSRRYLKICGRWRDHERWAILVEDWKSRIGSPGAPSNKRLQGLDRERASLAS
jgi:[ribosomal protein S5]-alanine N-acetyltransferase